MRRLLKLLILIWWERNSNQDLHNQIENNKFPGGEYQNKNDLDDTVTNKFSRTLNFMSQILPGDEITEDINSLNSKK